jgi:PAS domain S-box-containing protein
MVTGSGDWPTLADKDRFARVVEASPVALVLIGKCGRIEMVNSQTERMFGYDRAAMRGKPLEMLIPQRFRERHVDLRKAFFPIKFPRLLDERRNLFGLRQDGTELRLEIGLSPVDIDGRQMVLACIIDITARHEAELSIERQRSELERSNADLEEFAYVASHDLKAPLRAILHLAQWIGDDIGASMSPETRKNLALLQERVTRMQMLVDGLLNYARVGHSTSPAEDIDTGQMVHAIIGVLEPLPGFVVACEGTMPVIRAHRTPIQVVLENLIGNGLKHHDRAEGRITVSARSVDGGTEFRVSDDGPGIPPQFHERIFIMSQTLAHRDDIGSNGMGLAIVKKMVLAHGGQIRVESAPPARGTAFVFTWKEAVSR